MTMRWPEFLAGLLGIAVASGIATFVIELRWLHDRGQLRRARLREMLLSLSALPPNAVLTFFMLPVWAALYAKASEFAHYKMPLGVIGFVCAFFAVEFSYYWQHRCAHKVLPLWRLYHGMHHTSNDYTVATAYRVSCLHQLLAPAYYLPWLLLGLPPLMIVGWQMIVFHGQAWSHTEVIGRLGKLDHWINTPAAHRMHHSAADEHRTANLGALTLIFDHLFGTYVAPQPKVVYGAADIAKPASIFRMYWPK
jgi:sterol desaturase/sphingolipid hydroxylase (fatty acid hydroxylase superfamily)